MKTLMIVLCLLSSLAHADNEIEFVTAFDGICMDPEHVLPEEGS